MTNFHNISPRPFLKWAGGKSQLLQQYQPFFPCEFKNYYEPFLGGGAVFFHLQPKSAILTDINSELINAYRCVKDRVEPLIARLAEHQLNHDREYYYWVRSQNSLNREFSSSNPDIERASRLIYLNKTCFNGLYRENSQGEFNVPLGKYKNPKICHPDLLRSVSHTHQFAQIDVNPFESVLDYAKTGDDFVYFDPPYHPLNCTSNFTAYSRHSFAEDDQIKLRDIFVELASQGVKVMLSNSDSPLIVELYQGFQIYKVAATRFINSNAEKRGKISELLVTSYDKNTTI